MAHADRRLRVGDDIGRRQRRSGFVAVAHEKVAGLRTRGRRIVLARRETRREAQADARTDSAFEQFAATDRHISPGGTSPAHYRAGATTGAGRAIP